MLNLVNNVFKVYNGKINSCCCGCSGKYNIASAYREYAEQDRGHPYTEQEVNDSIVRKVVGKILASETPQKGDGYFYTTVGKRMYVAYYKNA